MLTEIQFFDSVHKSTSQNLRDIPSVASEDAEAVLSSPGTGIQLAVSDTDTAPEGLFFELVKPPHHGIVLKYSAGVQERMRAGKLSRSLPWRRKGVSVCLSTQLV